MMSLMMFAAKYESFFIDDEPEYGVFQFDDLCSSSKCVISSVLESDSLYAFLDLKPLPDSLKYSFLGLDDSLLIIIAFDLDRDQLRGEIN